MKYGSAATFRQALEDRLKERAGRDGARIARLRKQVAFDRLLARLASVAPGLWALKGGFALELRLADRARTTIDVDIAWSGHENELLDTLIDAATEDLGDFFSLSIERTADPAARFGGAHRFRVGSYSARTESARTVDDRTRRQAKSYTATSLSARRLILPERRPAIERITDDSVAGGIEI